MAFNFFVPFVSMTRPAKNATRNLFTKVARAAPPAPRRSVSPGRGLRGIPRPAELCAFRAAARGCKNG